MRTGRATVPASLMSGVRNMTRGTHLTDRYVD